MKLISVLLKYSVMLLVVIATVAQAKDHRNEYQMGTLTKVPLRMTDKTSAGFTDTTSCHDGLAGVHCTGGVVDDYHGNLVATLPDGSEVLIGTCAGGASLAAALMPCTQEYVLMLTKEDGTTVFLDHVWMRRNSAVELAAVSKVLYRTKHVRGLMSVDYVMIPDATDANKEGQYTVIKLPKQPPQPLKEATSPATDNITAMCASDKLSPELKAKYCH